MSELSRQQPAGQRRHRASGPTRMPFLDSGAHGHVDDLLPAYALDALDPQELETVDRHLRFCGRCAEQAVADMKTVAMLPFTSPRFEPSPDVKVALFSRIAHAQRAAVAAKIPTQTVRQLPPTLTIPASRPAPAAATPAGRRFGRSQPRFGWVASVVSVPLLLALIVTGFWGMNLRGQVSQQSDQMASLRAQVANFAAGAQKFELQPGKAATAAAGSFLFGNDLKGGIVNIDLNQRPPAGSRSVEVWGVNKDGNVEPLTEVQVDDQGKGSAQLNLNQPFSQYQSVHVKAKPAATAESDASKAEDALIYDPSASSIGSPDSATDPNP